MKWPEVQLGQVALNLQPGFACRPSDGADSIPQLRTNNVSSDGRIDLGEVKSVPAKASQVKKYSLRPGDVLFNNTNSPALVGKTAYFDQPEFYLFSNHMTRIRVDERLVDPRFAARFLHWTWKTGGFRKLVTQWVNQAAINRSQIASVLVPVPPVSEQRRIVEILDQADALRKLRADADSKAERILPALFIKMFGDPVTNPMGWESSPLGELATDLRYGTSKRCHTEPTATPVLRIPNVIGGEIDTGDLKYCELPGKERARINLAHGDLLFVRTNGNPDYVGRCAVFEEDKDYIYASYLIRARLDPSSVEPRYVAAFLQTPWGRRAMAPFIRTTAGQSNINTAGLRQISIPLPPRQLQVRFRMLWDDMRALGSQRSHSGAQLGRLFTTLLHRAFSGDLTASWREVHMNELIEEMEQQAKALNGGEASR